MEKKVAIKEATANDYQIVAEIYNEHIRSGTATMDEAIKTADDVAKWIHKFNAREKLFVLKEDDVTIGWGIIKRYSDREGYRFACETAVYLTESNVGKGYGTMIKKHLIEVCKQLDYKHLVAKIFARNKGSIIYNQKLGYSIVGTQNQIGFRNGNWVNIVIMQYIID